MLSESGSSGREELPEEPRCVDCGKTATFFVDEYGIPTELCRCRGCYEASCQRLYREANRVRYG